MFDTIAAILGLAAKKDRMRRLFVGFAAVKGAAPPLSSQATHRFKGLLEGLSLAQHREALRASHLVSHFEQFLAGYFATRAELTEIASATAATFVNFFKGFEDARGRSVIRANEIATEQRKDIQLLLEGHLIALATWEKTQKDKADRFYILDVLGLMRIEECHSRMLAWLLDRNYRKFGTHAQGSLGFRLFLRALNLPTEMADEPYFVRREISGDESRIDIEVAARGRFLMHVEVKIGAQEGREQTTREWKDLCQRACELDVRGSEMDSGVVALFVTPSGCQPGNPNFKGVSWRTVAEVLDHFADECQPEAVKLFAHHYAHTLRNFIATVEQEKNEDTHGGPEI